MTPEVWDFIFYKDKPMPKNCKISKVRLAIDLRLDSFFLMI